MEIDDALVERIADIVERRLRGRSLPPTEYYDFAQAAAVVGLSEKALRDRHTRGKGPASIKMGGKVRFHRSAVVEWMTAQRVSKS
jgi:predicted DNA-binding transcriptional regulator AlpA